ncbi:MAG: McrB family protein [Symbiobacteriia bacterium]
MSDFATAWREGTLLEAPELIFLGREFVVTIAERVLELAGVPFSTAQRAALRQTALEKYLTAPGRMRFFSETPYFPGRGYRVHFKAFKEKFLPFEQMTIAPWQTGPGAVQGDPPVVLDAAITYVEAGGRFRVGDVFVGVVYWASLKAERGDGRARARRRLEEAGIDADLGRLWQPLGASPAWSDVRVGFGRTWQPGEWTGDQGELTERCAQLLAPMWQELPRPEARKMARPQLPPDPAQPGDPPAGPGLASRISATLAVRGYRFSPHQIAAFHGALKAKGLVILAGLSGTGKTRLAQEYADLLELDSHHFLLEPVRPDWRESSALLGYYNPLTGKYQSTRFLRLLLEAEQEYRAERSRRYYVTEEGYSQYLERRSSPFIVVLDEMNLARVEYYFADLLSVMESGRFTHGDDAGLSRGALHLHGRKAEVEDDDGTPIPVELHLPPNVFFVGTVNMDETTFSFSPKVLDRAFTLEFSHVDLESYLTASGGAAPGADPNAQEHSADIAPEGAEGETPASRYMASVLPDEQRVGLVYDLLGDRVWFAEGSLPRGADAAGKAGLRQVAAQFPWMVPALQELNRRLEPSDLHFGYRPVDEILAFVAAVDGSPLSDGLSAEAAFDLAVRMKVLPKFHGPIQRLAEPLKAVSEWAAGPAVHCPEVAAKVERMQQRLEAIGHASFL